MVKKTKKFWCLIKTLINDNDYVDVTSYIFRSNNGDQISKEETPDFLNEYFVIIARRTVGGESQIANRDISYNNVHTIFYFTPPDLFDMYGSRSLMDISSYSCIPGINANVCKISFDSISDKFRHLFATSLYTSKFPVMWTCAYVTLLPKTSNTTNPGDRPLRPTYLLRFWKK